MTSVGCTKQIAVGLSFWDFLAALTFTGWSCEASSSAIATTASLHGAQMSVTPALSIVKAVVDPVRGIVWWAEPTQTIMAVTVLVAGVRSFLILSHVVFWRWKQVFDGIYMVIFFQLYSHLILREIQFLMKQVFPRENFAVYLRHCPLVRPRVTVSAATNRNPAIFELEENVWHRLSWAAAVRRLAGNGMRFLSFSLRIFRSRLVGTDWMDRQNERVCLQNKENKNKYIIRNLQITFWPITQTGVTRHVSLLHISIGKCEQVFGRFACRSCFPSTCSQPFPVTRAESFSRATGNCRNPLHGIHIIATEQNARWNSAQWKLCAISRVCCASPSLSFFLSFSHCLCLWLSLGGNTWTTPTERCLPLLCQITLHS